MVGSTWKPRGRRVGPSWRSATTSVPGSARHPHSRFSVARGGEGRSGGRRCRSLARGRSLVSSRIDASGLAPLPTHEQEDTMLSETPRDNGQASLRAVAHSSPDIGRASASDADDHARPQAQRGVGAGGRQQDRPRGEPLAASGSPTWTRCASPPRRSAASTTARRRASSTSSRSRRPPGSSSKSRSTPGSRRGSSPPTSTRRSGTRRSTRSRSRSRPRTSSAWSTPASWSSSPATRAS